MLENAMQQAETSQVTSVKEVGASKVETLRSAVNVKAYVDFAAMSKEGDLAIIGWVFDPEDQVQGFAILTERRRGVLEKRSYRVTPLVSGINRVTIDRVSRLDVAQAMSGQVEDRAGKHGFVLVVPRCEENASLAMAMPSGKYVILPFVPLRHRADIEPVLQQYWLHSGPQFLAALRHSLGSDHPLTQVAATLSGSVTSSALPTRQFAACDHGFIVDDRTLILNGWIAIRPDQMEVLELIGGGETQEISSRIRRYARPDLLPRFPWSTEEPLGFVCVLRKDKKWPQELRLKIRDRNGQVETIFTSARELAWPELSAAIGGYHGLAGHVIKLLSELQSSQDPEVSRENIGRLQREEFYSRYPNTPFNIEDPVRLIGAIDRAFPLDEEGVLIFGWKLFPMREPQSISIRGEEGEAVGLDGRFSPLIRNDVAQIHRPRFSEVQELCGFVCLAPMPTRRGEARVLCFDYGELGEVWLKVPTDTTNKSSLDLVKEVLGLVPAPRASLFDVFDNGLGRAIAALSTSGTRSSPNVVERQFGEAPSQPSVSVIVPLFGRFDFIRHQLAHFVGDPDFCDVDLIYVVDDPSITYMVQDMAISYYQLFELPFRVVWYGVNLGFAGANNVGAKLARAETLLLLNSDVIPKHPGWLGELHRSLLGLPEAGAVGPLLLFSDDSIQHAGMRPREDPVLPGFLLNIHPGKGQAWNGDQEPVEQPLLTGACIMLRTRDYLEAGGLDEGYLIGDFEDSDLCLALRKEGKRLWLVPAAALWHLERQSQNASEIVGSRQLLTFYNGWRYVKKIRSGEIASPDEAGG